MYTKKKVSTTNRRQIVPEISPEIVSLLKIDENIKPPLNRGTLLIRWDISHQKQGIKHLQQLQELLLYTEQ